MLLRTYFSCLLVASATCAFANPTHAQGTWNYRSWSTEGSSYKNVGFSVSSTSRILSKGLDFPFAFESGYSSGGVGDRWAGFRATIVLSVTITENTAEFLAYGIGYYGDTINGPGESFPAIGHLYADSAGFIAASSAADGVRTYSGIHGNWAHEEHGDEFFGWESGGTFKIW